MTSRHSTLIPLACFVAASLPQALFAHGNPRPPQQESSSSTPAGGPGSTTPGRGSGANPSRPGPASPSNPSTPSYGGPNTGGPAAGGPSTGGGSPSRGGGGPRTGGRSGPTAGSGLGGPMTGGAPLEFKRGSTSMERLEIEWDYPVPEDGITQALSFEQALAAVRGDDPRPLLIVRECLRCPGAARGLLDFSRGNDERTRLLTRWFHCVRLPTNVWEKEHPFHELFRGMGVSHLFVTSSDGTSKLAFSGTQTRSRLWSGMERILASDYTRSPKPAIAKMRKHLDTYDMLDSKITDALAQFDRALENHGPKSSKFKKAQKRLKRHKTALAKAEAREKKISDIGLKRSALDD